MIKDIVKALLKRITFNDIFFLAPLAVDTLHKINYIAKSPFIKT